MKDNQELLDIARRVVWFEPPEKVIKNKRLFLTYLMTYGTDEDTDTVRSKYYSRKDFIEVLQNPLIGVFDKKSWKYWHVAFFEKYIDEEVPNLPKRKFI